MYMYTLCVERAIKSFYSRGNYQAQWGKIE